ncbi:MAG: hypothetical protein GY866_38375, partial [Proteobacteria bacterium]|nr:hypothetical protein [Pseudomonadota bacterium]
MLDRKSIIFTAERRVGKTSIMRKMLENPGEGWEPILVLVESVQHPIECVQYIYREVDRLKIRSSKAVWAGRFKNVWNTIARVQFGKWSLPEIRSVWKDLLKALIEDIAENSDARLLIMLDEYPHMINNIITSGENGPALAAEFLDVWREIRQTWGGSGHVRFIYCGSIGLHLVLDLLRKDSGYKGKPTNDMDKLSISGMTRDETAVMCRKYLEEERIERTPEADFDLHMFEATDGLPLYIQYVCEQFQITGMDSVTSADIDQVLDDMINSSDIEWFRDADDRIQDYYARLGKDHIACHVLDELSRNDALVSEKSIIDYVKSQTPLNFDREARDVLDLLWQDHYIVRDASSGGRRYGFKYKLMRGWWFTNRG